MFRPYRGSLLGKLLTLAVLAIGLGLSLLPYQRRTQAQGGCPQSSYDYCDANYGMWVNPYSCSCAPYCSLTESDCTERGRTLDYDSCQCVGGMLTVFDPCDPYDNSIYCGGNTFSETFSGITWVYGNGNCNPAWASSCAGAGGGFNYNTCKCDLGSMTIPPTASPTPPSIDRCPGTAAATACANINGRWDQATCTCSMGP